MILVDSSVWIDAFRGKDTEQTQLLHRLLGTVTVAVGDLMLVEVLQGLDTDFEYRRVLDRMQTMPIIEIAGELVAMQAAQNFRLLRSKGFTIRKTIDSLIATRCILDRHQLLYSDRDFDPFVDHLGLQVPRPNNG